MSRTKLSLAGCTSRQDARARFRAWATGHLAAIEQRNETSALRDVQAGHLDLSIAADVLATMHQANLEFFEDLCQQFERWLDQVGAPVRSHGDHNNVI